MDYYLVYTPSESFQSNYPNKRFLVSHRQLYKYIGTQNANKAITIANSIKTDKYTIKFRKFGKIDIYLK